MEWAWLFESEAPRGKVNTIRFGEILRDHRAVEGDQAGSVVEGRHQAGKVAVADKDFRMGCDFGYVHFFQKVVGPVAAACTDNGFDRIILEGLFQFADAPLRRSREVQLAIEDGIIVNRQITQAAQGVASRVEVVAIEVTRRRNDGNAVAGA